MGWGDESRRHLLALALACVVLVGAVPPVVPAAGPPALSFESSAGGASPLPDPWYVTDPPAGDQRIVVDDRFVSAGERSLNLASFEKAGPIAVAVDLDLSRVAAIRYDAYAASASRGGTVAVLVGTETVSENLGQGTPEVQEWYYGVEAGVSRFNGEHTLRFLVEGEGVDVHVDNVRFLDESGEPLPLDAVRLGASGPETPGDGAETGGGGAGDDGTDGAGDDGSDSDGSGSAAGDGELLGPDPRVEGVLPAREVGERSPVLLDSGRKRLGAAVVDGDGYVAYEYQNTVPYAGGVEILTADGERVTDRRTARAVAASVAAQRVLSRAGVDRPERVAGAVRTEEGARELFRAVAWDRAGGQVEADDIERLQRTRRTAARVDDLVSPPLSALERTLGAIDWMKSNGVGGVSAWDVATSAAPKLEGFEQVARALRDELAAWDRDAEAVRERVPPAVAVLERVERGQPVDHDRATQRLDAAAGALGDFEEQSDQLHDRLTDTARASGQIADNLADEPFADRVAGPFRTLQDTLGELAGQVETVRDSAADSRQTLTEARQTAQSTESSLLDGWRGERERVLSRWNSRKSAEERVYGTVGGGTLGVVGLAVWLFRP